MFIHVITNNRISFILKAEGWTWCYISVIPELGKLRIVTLRHLVYIARLCLKKKNAEYYSIDVNYQCSPKVCVLRAWSPKWHHCEVMEIFGSGSSERS
jgi:hypothetical protein